VKPCRCGHGRVLHQHHRIGTDCAIHGCGCQRYRRPRRWRRTPNVPAAVKTEQARLPPAWPDPPPGLPRHDHGPIVKQGRRWRCGCELAYDGDWHITAAKGCRQVADLRQWDHELKT
jgi:hypothetical protein